VRGVTGFLTVFPVKKEQYRLSEIAEHIYLFPLVGAGLGLLAGIFGWLALHTLPPVVVGMLVLGSIALMSRFHHVDGLIDFGDGIMAMGPPRRKIKVMHDQKVGAGGVAVCLIVFLTTAFCIAELGLPYIIPALAVAEISAKFSMIVVATAGRSARRGMNTYFVNAMRGKGGQRRFFLSLLSCIPLAVLLLGLGGLVGVAVGACTGLVITVLAHRHLGGVTGDVFGASNEVARMTCLIATVGLTRWA
jgi:adenosylcobinamide-GDP ribazoletransferase